MDGEGALIVNNQPTALDVSGTITPDGQAALNLVSHDSDTQEGGMELDLTLGPKGVAEGNVNNTTVPDGFDVVLSQPPSGALKLWNNELRPNETEAYRVEARGGSGTFKLDVVLEGQVGLDIQGHWTLASDSSPMFHNLTGGRVIAGNVGSGSATSYLTFADSEGQATYGTVWFVRMSDGIANSQSPIFSTSRLNGQEVQGTVTLVQP